MTCRVTRCSLCPHALFSQARSHIRFAQEHFLRPHLPQIDGETLGNFGYHRCRTLPLAITVAGRTQLLFSLAWPDPFRAAAYRL